jgi:hypothetical protein
VKERVGHAAIPDLQSVEGAAALVSMGDAFTGNPATDEQISRVLTQLGLDGGPDGVAAVRELLYEAVQKYAPGQARDAHGRFASGGFTASGLPKAVVASDNGRTTSDGKYLLDSSSAYSKEYARLQAGGWDSGTMDSLYDDSVTPDERRAAMMAHMDHAAQVEGVDQFADTAVMQAAVDSQPVAVRMNPTALVGMVNDGRMKTQFETRTSNGMLDQDRRALAEETMFGYPTDLDPKKRPIYGYMSPDYDALNGGGPTQYGPVKVLLKDQVRPRTTVSFGDTLSVEGTLPAPLEHVDRYAINTHHDYYEPTDFEESLHDLQSSHYIEAQIHGGVTLDDVASIEYPSWMADKGMWGDAAKGAAFVDALNEANRRGIEVTGA